MEFQEGLVNARRKEYLGPEIDRLGSGHRSRFPKQVLPIFFDPFVTVFSKLNADIHEQSIHN